MVASPLAYDVAQQQTGVVGRAETRRPSHGLPSRSVAKKMKGTAPTALGGLHPWRGAPEEGELELVGAGCKRRVRVAVVGVGDA